MKSILVARKYLLEMLREFQLMALVLLIPAAFMVITAIGYGNSPRLPTYEVLVDDQSASLQASELIREIENQRYPDGRGMFHLQKLNDALKAEELLKAQQAALLLTFMRDAQNGLDRTVKGDATSMKFITGSAQLEKILVPLEEKQAGLSPLLALDVESIALPAPQNEFDAYTPGMMVMAILLLIPQTALLVGRELRQGSLRRLEMAPLKTWELFAGIALAQMVVAVIQVLLMFATALALGYHARGSLADAIVIGMMLSAGSIGMGLVVACFINNDSEALNTGGTISMLQVFLSGAFFAFATPALFTIAGYEIGWFDWMPATHAMQALSQVLTSGASLGQVWFRFSATVALSIFYFIAGVLIFDLKRRRT